MCYLAELKNKEVINLKNGYRLGFVGDCAINLEEGRIESVVIPGRWRFFGILGREEDFIIPWEDVKKIGDDVLLVEYDAPGRSAKGRILGRFE